MVYGEKGISVLVTILIIFIGQNPCLHMNNSLMKVVQQGAQYLSGRVLDSRPRGRGFEPHRRHCVVVLEQDTFILA